MKQMLIIFTALLLAPMPMLPASLAAQTRWRPPVHLDYDSRAGVYLLTYASRTQSPVFEEKIEAALALPHIKGVSHYQCWSDFEKQEDVYDWRELDHVIRLAKKHGKYAILGFQAGVMAPEWLLRRADVWTVDFVHNNPGWTKFSTIQTPAKAEGRDVVLSRMALPWDATYSACLERALAKIAERYQGETGITFLNVCGPSASGGVEANFNVNWKLSRLANPDFDRQIGFTLAKYTKAWKSSINLHLKIFPQWTLGLGSHHVTGSSGFDGSNIVTFTTADQMAAARDIRDYFLRRHADVKGTPGLVRNCGLSLLPGWGDPDRTDDKPASLFTALEWEVRDRALIGYESGGVSSVNGSAPGRGLTAEEFARLLRNGLTGYGRYLEIKVPDIVNNRPPYGSYEPYRPVLEEVSRILDNK